MGSVSDTYDPRPASKPGEKTPKISGCAKSSPLLGGPALPEGQSRARCVGCCKILTPDKEPHCCCPAGQLGLGAGQMDFRKTDFGSQNGVNGVRFGYVRPDAGFKTG